MSNFFSESFTAIFLLNKLNHNHCLLHRYYYHYSSSYGYFTIINSFQDLAITAFQVRGLRSQLQSCSQTFQEEEWFELD